MKYWYLVSLNWCNVSIQNVQRYSESPLPNPNYSSLFVHPPGLQLTWRLLSLSVGSSESIWVTLSRYRYVCDTSLSILCMLSSARSFSNSRILIFSCRLLSADKISENYIHISFVRSKKLTHTGIHGYDLYSAQNTINNQVRFLGFGWWCEWTTRCRCSWDILVVWHHVAHAVAMERCTTTIAEWKTPCTQTNTNAVKCKLPALLVSGSPLLGDIEGRDWRTRVWGVLTKGWWTGYSLYEGRDRLSDTTLLAGAAGAAGGGQGACRELGLNVKQSQYRKNSWQNFTINNMSVSERL